MQALPAIQNMLRGLGGAPTVPGRDQAVADARMELEQHLSKAAPMTPRQLLELGNRRYAYARDAKRPLLRTWATCLAFYLGDQYRQWNRKQLRLVEPTRIPSWRVQLVDQQIPAIVETVASKLSRSRDLPEAQPNTTDPEDLQGAEAGTKALAHWWHVDGMEQKELQANISRILFGDAFFHDFWDPNRTAKVPVQDPMTGAVSAVRAPVGDVATEVLSVFQVFPEPCEEWDDCRWVILARRKPLEWFRQTFPENGSQVRPDQGDGDSVFESLLPSSGGGFDGQQQSAPQGEQSATLKVMYEKPCPDYPQGRHVMWAGETLLFHADELPLPHGEIPVTQFGYRWVPQRVWSMGLIESLLGPQRELNRAQSYMLESLRLHGRPQRLLPRECRVDKDNLTSAPDDIIEYDGIRAQPSYLSPPPLPAWIQELPPALRDAMRQIAGQHEVSNAQVPSGVTAASAIRLLQEQDDTRLAVPALLGKRALEQTASHVLATIVERYREPRLIATLGRGKVESVMALMGSDIGQRDVLVNITEGVANSDAAKTETFFAWMNSGAFDKLFAGQYPAAFVLNALQNLGESWMSDALTAGMQEQAEKQAAAMMLGGQVADEDQEDADAMAMEQQTALQGQQDQEMRAAEGQRKDAKAQREHEVRLARLKSQSAEKIAKNRPRPQPAKKGKR